MSVMYEDDDGVGITDLNGSALKDNLFVDLSSIGNKFIKAGEEARVSPPQECARTHRNKSDHKNRGFR